MNIINLQQHPVIVIPRTGNPVTFASEGRVQVRMRHKDLTENGLVKQGRWTHSADLPPQRASTLYIVSSLVAMFELYNNGRTDLLFPWGMVKNEHGRVIGCKALCRPTSDHAR